jgi:hypothetical protein
VHLTSFAEALMESIRRSHVGVIAIVAGACSGDAPRQPFSELSLGTVDAMGEGFVPIPSDLLLTFDRFPHEGAYALIKYRLRGYAAGNVLLTKSIHRSSDQFSLWQVTTTMALPAPAADGTWELPSPERWQACPGREVILAPLVLDKLVVLRLEVTDESSGDTLATASAESTARCADDPCRNVCSGGS